MPSLEIPPPADHLSAIDAVRSAAIALFTDRAAAVDKRFTLTDKNAPIVADICRRLDGIPLAIELAAARVKMLSPKQLRERLDERFRVLTGGNRSVLPRATDHARPIDWSHDLLDERERVLFRRLGIFVNGFTLEGAVAVGSSEDLDESASSTCSPRWSISRWCSLNRRVTRCVTGCSNRRVPMPRRSSAMRANANSSRVAICAICAIALWSCGNGASGPHELPIVMRRCRPNSRTCVRARRGVGPFGNHDGASCSPALTRVGKPSDSRRKAWPSANVSRGASRGQPRLRARLSIALSYLLVDSGNKVRAFELATRRSRACAASGMPRRSHRALCQQAIQQPSSIDLTKRSGALAEAETIPGISDYLRNWVARILVRSSARFVAT